MDVFESMMFWVSEEKGMVSVMDKFGRGVNRTLQAGLLRPHDIKIFHSQRYNLTSKCAGRSEMLPSGRASVMKVFT